MYYRGLVGVSIPSSVTSINNDTFEGCTSLTSITIPSRVTSIGGYAFHDCTSLASITIPSSVTSISSSAFYGCPSLMITVDEANANYSSLGGSLYDKNKAKLIRGARKATIDDIPSSVTSIGGYAFSGCTSLTSITIPSSVTSIGGYAFSGCTSLTSITIPSSVTSIGSYAFNSCTSLSSITILGSDTGMGTYAFQNCTSLTMVTIDGQSVVDALTSQRGPSLSCLIEHATTIYIKSGLSTTSATYLTRNFTKQSSSDKTGYDKWVKNS